MQKETPNKTKFSATLGKLRREKGLSQRQAAAEFGISQALLSHYETGAREPKLDFIIRVCDYYSVTTDFILGRTKERGDGTSRLSVQINDILENLDELKAAETEIIKNLKKLTAIKKD